MIQSPICPSSHHMNVHLPPLLRMFTQYLTLFFFFFLLLNSLTVFVVSTAPSYIFTHHCTPSANTHHHISLQSTELGCQNISIAHPEVFHKPLTSHYIDYCEIIQVTSRQKNKTDCHVTKKLQSLPSGVRKRLKIHQVTHIFICLCGASAVCYCRNNK